MHIDKISYRKNFNISQFIFENIEVSVVLNEGENAIEALDTARQLVDEYHLKNNADIYAMRGTVERIIEPAIKTNNQSRESQVQSMVQAIESCTELKVLESYRLIVKNNPELKETYNQKLTQLS